MKGLVAAAVVGGAFYLLAHERLPVIRVLPEPSPLDAVATLVFIVLIGATLMGVVVALASWAKPRAQ